MYIQPSVENEFFLRASRGLFSNWTAIDNRWLIITPTASNFAERRSDHTTTRTVKDLWAFEACSALKIGKSTLGPTSLQSSNNVILESLSLTCSHQLLVHFLDGSAFLFSVLASPNFAETAFPFYALPALNIIFNSCNKTLFSFRKYFHITNQRYVNYFTDKALYE